MKVKQALPIFLKGLAMGAADVVPGVSGGTIAFITGIYARLIAAINAVGPTSLGILLKQGPFAFLRAIDGYFLLTLLAGIVTSIVSLARIISSLLETHPLLLWSFFFGLVLASAVYMLKSIELKRVLNLVMIGLGTVAAIVVTMLRPAELEVTPLVVMAGGAIAICAMILPGVSGSFLLLMMGLYKPVIAAIKNVDLVLIASFACGAGVGLLAFSHLLNFLLKRFFEPTLAVLIGFLLGSLNLIWPWKVVTQTYIDRHGVEKTLSSMNVLPSDYALSNTLDPQLLTAVLLMAFGFSLVFALEYLGKAFVDDE